MKEKEEEKEEEEEEESDREAGDTFIKSPKTHFSKLPALNTSTSVCIMCACAIV